MSFAYLVSLVLLGSIAFALVREMRKADPRPAGLRGHIRARGWGLLLLPVALMAAVMTGHVHALAVAELATAGALVTWAPRLAAKLVPYALLALALFGLILAKSYHEGFNNPVLYGLVLAGASSFRTRFVLPQAGVFFVLGMWLLLRVQAPGAGLVRALIARWLDPRRGGVSPRQGLLLIPVTAMALFLMGPRSLVRHAVDRRVGGGRSRRGHRRGQPGPGVPLAGLGRDCGRGRAARARCLRAGDRGVLAVRTRIRLRFRLAGQPELGDPRHGRAGHRAARAGAVAGAAGDARARDAPGRRRARGPGPAADPAGADADPDAQRGRGHRGRRTAPDRAGPARRRPGPAGRGRA